MSSPFSDREAGEVLARLDSIVEALSDLRRDHVTGESRTELALAAQRQERMKDIDRMRGELGRRIDKLTADVTSLSLSVREVMATMKDLVELRHEVQDLSAQRWRDVGFRWASAVAWTVFSGLLGFYLATNK